MYVCLMTFCTDMLWSYVRIMSFQKGVKFLMFVLMIEKSRVKNFNFFHVSRRTRILPVILKNTMNFQTVVNSFMAWNTWSTVFRTWTNSKFMKYVLVTGYLTYNRWLPDYFITFIQKYTLLCEVTINFIGKCFVFFFPPAFAYKI